MAVCSLSFVSNKRNHGFTLTYHVTPAAKRSCLLKMDLGINNPSKFTGCFDLPTSSESDVDLDDQHSCYIADQIRAKRRASSRISFCSNDRMSKALSQYSDDDEALNAAQRHGHLRTSSIYKPEEEDLDWTISNFGSMIASPASSTNLRGLSHKQINSGTFLHISDSSSLSASIKRIMPACDKQARARCFDYLIGAIDEAWASYCTAASYVEDETYGYNSPISLATDDEDYCGDTTDLTEYNSDHEKKPVVTHKQGFAQSAASLPQPSLKKTSIFGASAGVEILRTGQDPLSCRLLALKERLIKAKYFLQDLVDSDKYTDSFDFWQRWDMIKYATIELVEDDDDDAVMESTIDDLECGRQFSN